MYTKTVYFISQISTLKMGFRTVYFITPVYFISIVYFISPPPPVTVAEIDQMKSDPGRFSSLPPLSLLLCVALLCYAFFFFEMLNVIPLSQDNLNAHRCGGRQFLFIQLRMILKNAKRRLSDDPKPLVSLIRLLNVLNIGYSSIFFVVFLDPFCFVVEASR